MSFDAYKVAVKLSLVNNVSSGLTALSTQFIGLNKHIKTSTEGLAVMESKLASIKRMALVGGAMAGAGVGMLMSLRGPIGQAIEWEREASKLKQMGLGDAQIAEAQKFAEATKIMGTSIQQRMKLFVEAQGSFRESGMAAPEALSAAKVMMPVLAKYQVASGLLTGDHQSIAKESMRNLNKTVEIMGGLNSSARATEIANGIFKAVQSSGKMVDERQLKQFVAYGGSATNQLGIRAIFGGMEPIIGEFGGSTAAVGLRTAYTRMNGMMALLPKRLKKEMVRLGIADSTGIEQTHALADLEATDITAYAKKMMDIYAKHGIVSQTDRERENAVLFGTNGSKVINKIMYQMPVIERSLAAYDQAHGINRTISDNKDSPMMAIEKFKSALNDLGLTMGRVVLPYLTPMVKDMTKFFTILEKHPTLVKTLTIGFVGLGVAMAFGGTVMLLTSAFKGLSLAMSVFGTGGALASSMPLLAKGITALGMAVKGAAGVGVAGAVGYGAGTLLYEHAVKGTKVEDVIGMSVASVLGLFGNKDAQYALRMNDPTRNTDNNKPTVINVLLDGKKVGTQLLGGPNQNGTSGLNPGMSRPMPATPGMSY